MNDQTRPLVFVLMPFSPEYRDLLEHCIRPAAEAAGASAQRVDEQSFSTSEYILERIKDQITRAAVIVAVASGCKPNVFYELGAAHAMHKHVIILLSEREEIPFDLNQFTLLKYGIADAGLVSALTDKIRYCLSHPCQGDQEYQEFREAFEEVRAQAKELTPFFTPIASRFFHEWTEYTRKVVAEGDDMRGPERLKITRAITLATRKYSLIERFPGNPKEVHSSDWRSFYDTIGARDNIRKQWTLCVEESEIRRNWENVVQAWTFFHERNFRTSHLSPKDYQLASGDQLPDYQVIEHFGAYVKLLKISGGGYTSGEKANFLHTTIRECSRTDQDMLACVENCSREIDLDWIRQFASRTLTASGGSPSSSPSHAS